MSGPTIRGVATAIARRNLRNFLTTPAILIPQIAFPLFFLVAFVGGLSGIEDVPGFDFPSGFMAFEFVFVLLQASAGAGAFVGFAVAFDFESGFSRRLMLAAPNRLALIGGYLLAGLGATLATWVALVVAALIAGMQVDGAVLDLLGLLALAVLVNLAATLWAAGLAMRIRSTQAGGLIQLPIFVLFFVTPVFLPLALLTGWIHAVAEVNPITALLQTGRGFISGEPELAGLAFAVGLALVACLGYWAIGGLRRAEAAGG